MEVLKRFPPALLLPALLTLLTLTGCEYIGFDGYINQLEELGITHDLADAVTFNQHLTSRPREFRGKVYVLGTRGVFVMDADQLTSYQFYAYENADRLDYHSDYERDELPPINCFIDSGGNILITSLNSDGEGLRYGDSLRLYEDPRRAEFIPIESGWFGDDLPVAFIYGTTGEVYYVVNDPFNDMDFQDTFGLWTYPGGSSATVDTSVSTYLLDSSIRTDSTGTTAICVTQPGIPFSGYSGTSLSVYLFTAGAWDFTNLLGTVTPADPLRHDTPRNGYGEFISGSLRLSTNDRYLLLWGDAFEDESTMVVYDIVLGAERLRVRAPSANLNAELAEEGLSIYTSSVLGGVARYDYE